VQSYTWNARNQLASLTGPVSGSFAYDGVGRRRSKTIGGTTTQFLYDGVNPVQELSTGTPTANLLTGLGTDEYFSRTDGAGARSYLADALGSTVALADGSGTVQTDYSYGPFGTTTTSGASTNNSIAFTGREADGTGLHYYRARYLHAESQRFVSEDPLGLCAADMNLYSYVRNGPTMYKDPLGLKPKPSFGGGAGSGSSPSASPAAGPSRGPGRGPGQGLGPGQGTGAGPRGGRGPGFSGSRSRAREDGFADCMRRCLDREIPLDIDSFQDSLYTVGWLSPSIAVVTCAILVTEDPALIAVWPECVGVLTFSNFALLGGGVFNVFAIHLADSWAGCALGCKGW
jgi:RHS repeat-associated protein